MLICDSQNCTHYSKKFHQLFPRICKHLKFAMAVWNLNELVQKQTKINAYCTEASKKPLRGLPMITTAAHRKSSSKNEKPVWKQPMKAGVEACSGLRQTTEEDLKSSSFTTLVNKVPVIHLQL